MKAQRFSNGQTTEEFHAALALAQAINPHDREDAWYIVTHPKDFDAETQSLAEKTYARLS